MRRYSRSRTNHVQEGQVATKISEFSPLSFFLIRARALTYTIYVILVTCYIIVVLFRDWFRHNWRISIMEFACPRCRGGSMRITSSIELPPDSRSDEITVQILKCSKCGFAGLGIYEETRRGRLDSESIHHRGYYVDDSTLASIERMISKCLKPKKSGCRCRIHRSLGCVNEFGRWNWLEKIPYKETFKLQII